MKLSSILIASLVTAAYGWVPSSTASSSSRRGTVLEAVNRRQALQEAFAVASAGAVLMSAPLAALADETLPNGVTYSVTRKGDGPKPEVGELVAIRFSAYAGDLKIDDIFDTPEPYYTRIGSGALIKGVEDALPLMRLGDRWVLSIPVRVERFRGAELRVWSMMLLAIHNEDPLSSAFLHVSFHFTDSFVVTGQTGVR
jgi:FKBP-type peptidyl-prolyl cis-trans isomerase